MLTSAFLKQAVERKSVCSPFFDLLNHKPSLEANAQFQVAVQSDSGGVAASTNGDGSKSGRSIQVSATKNIPAGQQIFVSYIANSISSGKDDWYLLHRYGFCSSDGENASPPPAPTTKLAVHCRQSCTRLWGERGCTNGKHGQHSC